MGAAGERRIVVAWTESTVTHFCAWAGWGQQCGARIKEMRGRRCAFESRAS